MNNGDFSIVSLLYDGKKIPCLNKEKMISSLLKHDATLQDVNSLEDEIINKPHISGGSVFAAITLFLTVFSGYLVTMINSLTSLLSIRTAKMNNSQFMSYWHRVGRFVLTRISYYSNILNEMSILVIIVVILTILIWGTNLYFTLINRMSIDALHEYKRKYLFKK